MRFWGTRKRARSALTDDDRAQYAAIRTSRELHCWRHFMYAPSESAARAIAAAATRDGWAVPRLAPAAGQNGWAVVAQQHDINITEDAITSARSYFTSLARVHRADYDGWEAAPMSKHAA